MQLLFVFTVTQITWELENLLHLDIFFFKLICFCFEESNILLKKMNQVLAGVIQWTDLQPANQKVASSIPSQGT